MTGDLLTAYICRAAALAATGVGVRLAITEPWWTALLTLWLVPSCLLVGGRAHATHTERTGEGQA